jgi:hypothetical protein
VASGFDRAPIREFLNTFKNLLSPLREPPGGGCGRSGQGTIELRRRRAFTWHCGMCRDVASWFAARAARHLTIIPAETHPSRALDHIHLGWAVVGCIVRLPPIAQLVQLLADASGAGPRDIRSSAGRQCDTSARQHRCAEIRAGADAADPAAILERLNPHTSDPWTFT